MAQTVYRGNLSAANFPFVSTYQGQTVIVPGSDNNFNRQVLASSTDADKDVGIPQAYYMHNVMPTGNGLQSVGFEQQVDGYNPGYSIGITAEYTLRDEITNNRAFAFHNPGAARFYILLGVGPTWTTVGGYYDTSGNYVSFSPGVTVTIAHVNGITYVYLSNTVCMVFDFSVNQFRQVILLGLNLAATIGITECNGYLIAYSATAVAWSSTISATDFVPSLQTGAGGGAVQGAKGVITCANPTANGFIVYTQTNAVSALYTANARFPFQFNECLGSGGVLSLERVSYESDTGYNYAYTSKGLQILQAKAAQTSFPDVTDFLAGQLFEDFVDSTLGLTQIVLTSPMNKKLTFVAGRYLIISYGITLLTHALVYDTVQKRFGKLKFTHVDCFEYELLTENVSDIPRKSIAFVDITGKISTVDFSTGHDVRSGVLILGKFQYARSRRLQLQSATIESVNTLSTVSVYDQVTQDGKTPTTPILGTLLNAGTKVRQYGFGSPDGINHSLILVGTFNLASFELAFNITGTI